MLEHNLDSHGILHLHPKGSLQKEDFAALAKSVDPYIEKQGDLAHKRVKKIAVVTDAKLGDFAEKIGSHFIAATIRHFPAGQAQVAEAWILGKS